MFLSACRILMRCQKLSVKPIQASSAAFVNTIPCVTVMQRAFCSDVDPKDIVKAAVKKERPKTPEVPKITLLDEEGKIVCVTTKAEAEKMATSKKQRLVQIVDKDARTVRPVFQLMSEAQYIEEDLKLRKQNKTDRKKTSNSYIKGEKMMVITSKITTSDFDIKLRKVVKWLEKKFEVHFLISGGPESKVAQEEMFKKIETVLKDKSRIVQKVYKSGNLKFHALPLKDGGEEGDMKSDETNASSKNSEDIQESKAV